MRIGILTQQLNNNYGGLLQNWAMQQTLLHLGHTPVTLDWKYAESRRTMLSEVKSLIRSLIWRIKGVNSEDNNPTEDQEKSIGKKNCLFKELNIISTEKFTESRQFRDYCVEKGVEALVVGSDQCWRPLYNRDMIADMFFFFAEGLHVKRLSYAASFGTDKWEFSPEQTEVCKKLVKQFDLVTVREESGVKLCRDFLDVQAKHVLDPTMLLSKEDYINLIDKDKDLGSTNKNDEGLFHYILDPSPENTQFVSRIAKGLKLHLFTVMPRHTQEQRTKRDLDNDLEGCVFPGPIAWLQGFRDAKMVVCDSFHGCVFSIIFNKPFWVIGNKERGMSRFSSLLSLFGLEDRLIEANDSIDFEKPINWEVVNRKWSDIRLFSLNLLQDTLNK